jgi:hypothetical protein
MSRSIQKQAPSFEQHDLFAQVGQLLILFHSSIFPQR